jgi:DNA-directed RNA polymerase alpha subunit
MPAKKKSPVLCPLTVSPSKRRAADKLAGSVKELLPAGLSQPALRALAGAGYATLDQLAKVREADLAKLHGMGPKGIRTIQEALQQRGLSLQR